MKSNILRLFNILALMTCLAACMSFARAEACTYNEALLAFKQGNLIRGQALLDMAVKDGDRRAITLFAALKESVQNGGQLSEDTVRVAIAKQEPVN